jgi:hypothetical protein
MAKLCAKEFAGLACLNFLAEEALDAGYGDRAI